MRAFSPALPVVLAPIEPLGLLAGSELWLTSLEVWPDHAVIRCHLLGYEPTPGEPHAGGQVSWRIWVGSQELSWVSSLAGGAGAEMRAEYVFRSPGTLIGESPARLEWSGPGALHGSVELTVPTD
jgi:hypothetical protein